MRVVNLIGELFVSGIDLASNRVLEKSLVEFLSELNNSFIVVDRDDSNLFRR